MIVYLLLADYHVVSLLFYFLSKNCVFYVVFFLYFWRTFSFLKILKRIQVSLE